MLPDIGGTELLVIAAVALIVVGPKDLPILLRKLGQFVAKMRGMASEFRASFDEMARQSELDDLRREVQAMREGQFTSPIQAAADAAKDAHVDQVFADIDSGLNGRGASAAPEVYVAPEPLVEPAAKPARKPRAKAPVKAVAPEPVRAQPARKRASASSKDISVEAAKATRAPRKRASKAGGPTASDIIS